MLSPSLVEFGDPLFHAHRSIGKIHARGADPFDKNELRYAFGKCSGIEQRDSATHRVADELDRLSSESLNHVIEVKDVIGKMIVTAGADPAAVAVTAAVRRNDPEPLIDLFLKSGDEAFPAVRLIQKAMDQNQRLTDRVAPLESVEAQSLYVDELISSFAHAGLHLCQSDFDEIFFFVRPGERGDSFNDPIVNRHYNLTGLGKRWFTERTGKSFIFVREVSLVVRM
jgi:hypothetical protein